MTVFQQLSLETKYGTEGVQKVIADYIQAKHQKVITQLVDKLDGFRDSGESQYAHCIAVEDKEKFVIELLLKLAEQDSSLAQVVSAQMLKYVSPADGYEWFEHTVAVLDLIVYLCPNELFYAQVGGEYLWIHTRKPIVPNSLKPELLATHISPPCVVRPNRVGRGHSPYQTLKYNPVLGKGYDDVGQTISEDVLTASSQVELRFDEEMLNLIGLKPMKETLAKDRVYKLGYKARKKNTVNLVKDLRDTSFYLPTAYDKRGRMYTTNSYVSYQGDSYQKAILEFANKEEVTGSL